MPLDADLQPQTILRHHEFQCGSRVFHVHFGHGFVKSLEAEPNADSTKPEVKLPPLSSPLRLPVVGQGMGDWPRDGSVTLLTSPAIYSQVRALQDILQAH
jgi:hypothetical protein